MTRADLARYGGLGLPLAMAMLPIYVLVPNFYATEVGLGLGLTGAILFAARLVDTVQDPWLGWMIDRLTPRGWNRLVLAAAVGLAVAMAALLVPPTGSHWLIGTWLALALVATYSLHSLINITYLAWGARLSDLQAVRTQVAAWREGAGLLGVVLASVLPALLSSWLGQATAMALFAGLFALMLAAATGLLVWRAPRPQRPAGVGLGWRVPLNNRAFRQLSRVFFVNAVAVAIPATLALFFIADRLALADRAGLFLTLYFVSGAAGLPLWTRLANRVGKARAWRAGMAMACCAFVWAAWLGPGDAWAYAGVCLLCGLALGADLALPPALLADLIPPEHRNATAAYFGLWSLLAKLALAVSGLALPVLALLGYQPGQPAGIELALVYAALPCLLKIGSALMLSSLTRGETR